MLNERDYMRRRTQIRQRLDTMPTRTKALTILLAALIIGLIFSHV